MKGKGESVNSPLAMIKETMGTGAVKGNPYPLVNYSVTNLVDSKAIASAMRPLLVMQATVLNNSAVTLNYAKCAFTLHQLVSNSQPTSIASKLYNCISLQDPFTYGHPIRTMSMFYKNISLAIEQVTHQKAHNLAWSGVNFLAVSSVTCSAIVAVQSPVKTILVSLTKDNKLIPNFSGSALGLVRVLYRGTSSALSGSAIRTSYVTGAKEAKPLEDAPISKTGYVLGATFGELAVTQVSESLSTLKKADILPENFNWKTRHNFHQLMKGGFGARYLSGLVNISCLMLLSDNLSEKIAKKLALDNQKLAYTLGGATSGAIAGFCSYPFSALKDSILVQATVKDGKLINISVATFTKELYKQLTTDPKGAMKKCFQQSKKQLLIRMGLTAVIFSIVSGLGEALGSEPLKAIAPGLKPQQAHNPQGFFSTATTGTKTKVDAKPESSSNLKC